MKKLYSSSVEEETFGKTKTVELKTMSSDNTCEEIKNNNAKALILLINNLTNNISADFDNYFKLKTLMESILKNPEDINFDYKDDSGDNILHHMTKLNPKLTSEKNNEGRKVIADYALRIQEQHKTSNSQKFYGKEIASSGNTIGQTNYQIYFNNEGTEMSLDNRIGQNNHQTYIDDNRKTVSLSYVIGRTNNLEYTDDNGEKVSLNYMFGYTNNLTRTNNNVVIPNENNPKKRKYINEVEITSLKHLKDNNGNAINIIKKLEINNSIEQEDTSQLNFANADNQISQEFVSNNNLTIKKTNKQAVLYYKHQAKYYKQQANDISQCDINKQDHDGKTLLHTFLKEKANAAIAILISKSARIDIKDNDGCTAVDLFRAIYKKAKSDAEANNKTFSLSNLFRVYNDNQGNKKLMLFFKDTKMFALDITTEEVQKLATEFYKTYNYNDSEFVQINPSYVNDQNKINQQSDLSDKDKQLITKNDQENNLNKSSNLSRQYIESSTKNSIEMEIVSLK